MHPGGHHLHARREAGGHHRIVAISGGNLDDLGLDGAGGRVIYPHCGGLPFLAQGRGGQLDGGVPAWLSALGVTYTVEPKAGASARSMATLTWKVRVAASALAATSRTLPANVLPLAQPRTATSGRGAMAATLSSGTANTTSRAPSWAIAHHGRTCRHHLAWLGINAGHHAAASATSRV